VRRVPPFAPRIRCLQILANATVKAVVDAGSHVRGDGRLGLRAPEAILHMQIARLRTRRCEPWLRREPCWLGRMGERAANSGAAFAIRRFRVSGRYMSEASGTRQPAIGSGCRCRGRCGFKSVRRCPGRGGLETCSVAPPRGRAGRRRARAGERQAAPLRLSRLRGGGPRRACGAPVVLAERSSCFCGLRGSSVRPGLRRSAWHAPWAENASRPRRWRGLESCGA
jgi:hypothetical protein